MPRTALQTLGLLASTSSSSGGKSKWQCLYEYPLLYDPDDACRLRAIQAVSATVKKPAYEARSRNGTRSEQSMAEVRGGKERKTKCKGGEGRKAKAKAHERNDGVAKVRKVVIFKRAGPGEGMNWRYDYPPCGLPACRVCGVFIRMYVEEIERRTPGLVEDMNTST